MTSRREAREALRDALEHADNANKVINALEDWLDAELNEKFDRQWRRRR